MNTPVHICLTAVIVGVTTVVAVIVFRAMLAMLAYRVKHLA